MELVAKDKGGDWYYVGNGMYHCLTAKKELTGKIAAQYVPDPIKLWASKCEQAGITTSDHSAKVLKSNPVVCKLWEHAQSLEE